MWLKIILHITVLVHSFVIGGHYILHPLLSKTLALLQLWKQPFSFIMLETLHQLDGTSTAHNKRAILGCHAAGRL
jgi:hypothetical protein